MGLFRKGKTCVIAKIHRTDLVICSHSREGQTLSYRRINTVYYHLYPSFLPLELSYRQNHLQLTWRDLLVVSTLLLAALTSQPLQAVDIIKHNNMNNIVIKHSV